MRLDSIKLAGFKSFVDPVTIRLGSNLTGVVGPNGCGKSNIIDAVRWVTGESSAKQLRGDALDDVIFSGAKTRKPVGRAAIELQFDNADGKLGGQYAGFGEISVRRELSRDGQSQYYINGTKCRRRDVVDLFLGTGLGGRHSYAIIEQGSVGRLVEAKPDDVRQMLEEAAGISKYKERRRETENRIRHTRENLDRLNDLIGEVSKRLAQLKRQAKNAEKFKQYKQEERRLKAQLLALRWRSLGERAADQDRAVAEAEAELGKRREQFGKAEAEREQHQQAQQEANRVFQACQADFYSAESKLAQLDQAVRHAGELREVRTRELADIQRQLKDLSQRVESEQNRRETLDKEIVELAAALAQADEDEADVRGQVEQAEQDTQEALDRWEVFNVEAHTPLGKAEGQRARVEALERELHGVAQRLERLVEERQAQNPQPIAEALERLDGEIAESSKFLYGFEQAQSEAQNALQDLQAQRGEIERQLHEVRQQQQDAQGRLAALEALQQSALRQDDESLNQWLHAQGWGEAESLAQQLKVEPGWERAVEAALGSFVQALCIAGLAQRNDAFNEWPEQPLSLLDSDYARSSTDSNQPSPADTQPLGELVQGPDVLTQLLTGVFALENEARAPLLSRQLAPGQMLVTPSGRCYGNGWAQQPLAQGEDRSVLGREQAMQALRAEIAELTVRSEALQEQLQALQGKAQENDERLRELRQQLERQREKKEEQLAIRHKQAARLEQTSTRLEEIDKDMAQLHAQRERQEKQLEQAQAQLQEVETEAASINARREQLQTTLRDLRGRLSKVRDDREQRARERERLAVDLAARRSAAEGLIQSLEELAQRRVDLKRRGDELQGMLAVKTDAESQAQQRGQAEQSCSQSQAALQDARNRLAEVEAAAAAISKQVREAEQALEVARDRVQQLKVDHETVAVRRQTLVEQLAEIGHSPESLCEGLDESATVEDWEEQVERMERRIDRLGPINLAAIEEFDQEKAREAYLRSQHQDLIDALEELGSAIAKIDRETRSRFKNTFDAVNEIFQRLFPRLFGGGEASLEMTGDDLLDTGVQVMARPPGKRNTTIKSLSGGEKALTAVALLFALFELNPAPFCMLDEIDAPLDDANVGRFCDLVRDMSEQVQFIVITHNKLTMELVDQLHGVTMQEAGVSRLVSVDLDQALQMAG